MLPITQIYDKGQLEHSRYGTEAGNMTGTQDNYLSCAWESSVAGQSTTGQRGRDTSSLGSEIYLLKLERKLATPQ